ncbi:MAG TPA: plastocyanin/azurin family copper-binding protein [Anaerolineae bacterium]
MNKRWFYLISVLLLATLIAACGDNRPDSQVASSGGTSPDGNATVNVIAEEFKFALDSSRLNAGVTTFVIKNSGFMQHDFEISGNSIEQKTEEINPGESVEMTVELEPGTYTYRCTIPGHEQLGMRGTLTVS